MKTKGLVLSGGGARGAYQVGVISALADICSELKISHPFQIYTGVSAGAINASYLAAGREDFSENAKNLVKLWSTLTTDQIFYTDAVNLGRVGFKWLEQFSLGAMKGNAPAGSLLDTAPLCELLKKNLSLDQIEKNIAAGHLKAVAVTGMDYETSSGVTFIQGEDGIKEWNRPRRHSEKAKLTVEHIQASSAIPMLFPPVQIGQRFFGDGCIRNQSPCGPAIYMGAEKVFVIGVRHRPDDQLSKDKPHEKAKTPSIARVMNVLLNSVMLDGVEVDIERLERANEVIDLLDPKSQKKTSLRKIEPCWISPSVDIAEIAQKKASKLPRIVRYMLKGLGSLDEAREIVSYLLFEPEFCNHLIEIGFEDGMRNKKKIIQFLTENED